MPGGLQGFLAACLVVAIVICGMAACVIYANDCAFIYQRAENAMPEDGLVEIFYNEDGYAKIIWPENKDADGYFLKFLMTERYGERVIYTRFFDDNVCYLPELPLDEDLHIEIYSYNNYSFPHEQMMHRRLSENCLRISGDFAMPEIRDLAWRAYPDADTVQVRFEMDPGTTAWMYYQEKDGSLTPIKSLDQGSVTLRFGEDEQFPVPTFGETHTFVFDAVGHNSGYVYYGLLCDQFTVGREDLLGSTLYLKCQDEGHNAFTLTWNETKGERYEVQQYDQETGQWHTVHTVPHDGERTYYTGHLERYSSFRFRVVALGGQTIPGSEFAAMPAEVRVETQASLIYSTIWNIAELDVYSDAQQTEVIGRIPQGGAYSILDEENGLFRIRFREGYGYIDSRFCMINLPDFIGDICLYDITNSYDSLYKVHEFEIPEVTGKVTTGYKYVEQEEGRYLVPLLYPTALKLEKAAFAAMEEGYQIKIYDSYRPRKATLELYDIAMELLKEDIPEEIYADYETWLELYWYGEEDTLLWYNFLQEDLKIPQELIDQAKLEAENPQPEEPEEPTEDPEENTGGENGEDPEEPEKKTLEDYRPTYRELMTDFDRYSLDYFLAYDGSRHNQGVAMDMTLVDMYTGKDLEMQTSIHDLSWFSERKRNNDSAKILRWLMEEHGFVGLISEWWHFQDDEIRQEIDLPFMYYGITPEGWVADDHGWRYRTVYSEYYYDCTLEIDGVTYAFDSQGYATEIREETENTQPAA